MSNTFIELRSDITDTDMINWVEYGYTVRPMVLGPGQKGWTVRGMDLCGLPCGEGLTWRAAVKNAMRKEMDIHEN